MRLLCTVPAGKEIFSGRVLTRKDTLPIILNYSLNIKVLENQSKLWLQIIPIYK